MTKLKWDKFEGIQKIIYRSTYKDKPINFTIEKSDKRASLTYNNEIFENTGNYSNLQIQEAIESANPSCKNRVIVHTIKSNEKDKYNIKKIGVAQARRKRAIEEAIRLKEEKRLLKAKSRKEKVIGHKSEEKKKQKILCKNIGEEQRILQEIHQINIQDFVVRRSVFRCIHNNHEVVDLTAAVQVVGDDGKVRWVKVTAGYCKQCHIYFIMESTFFKLRNMGVVLCRISDEKTYLKTGYANGMKLASESILMQFGYNVSQQEGLSESRRQKILAVMIDNHVLSKNEIISYLDFFINQRQYQSKFELAISKWEVDREFVQGYRIGEYTQFGVNAIYRR